MEAPPEGVHLHVLARGEGFSEAAERFFGNPAAAEAHRGREGRKSETDGTSSHEEHFRTDHLLHNLGGRILSGGLVTAVAQAVSAGISLASIVVLARLLSQQARFPSW